MTKICTFSLFWQWKWWKYIFWTKSIKSTQKMGSYGVKSFSVSFETKKLQAKQNFPWPLVHKFGIWATVKNKISYSDVLAFANNFFCFRKIQMWMMMKKTYFTRIKPTIFLGFYAWYSTVEWIEKNELFVL